MKNRSRELWKASEVTSYMRGPDFTIHMTQINFRQLFGILAFILILVFIFAIIAITEKLSIIAALILIIVPLASTCGLHFN
ncbi:MAG: hypothetical protein WA364_29085 [Candidatus Nitrosopolaris sp.]